MILTSVQQIPFKNKQTFRTYHDTFQHLLVKQTIKQHEYQKNSFPTCRTNTMFTIMVKHHLSLSPSPTVETVRTPPPAAKQCHQHCQHTTSTDKTNKTNNNKIK